MQTKTLVEFDKNGNQVQNNFYKFVRVFLGGLLSVFFPAKIYGAEALNSLDAPYIIVSNHKSLIDPIYLCLALKKYPIHWIGKKELTKNKFFAKILDKLYLIPVDRHNTDLKAIRTCFSLLKQGGVLGIFPEGTRHKNGLMQEIENGAAMFVLKGNVPVVPVLIDGKFKLFRKTEVFINPPMDIDDIKQMGVNNTTCELLNERLKNYYLNFAKIK